MKLQNLTHENVNDIQECIGPLRPRTSNKAQPKQANVYTEVSDQSLYTSVIAQHFQWEKVLPGKVLMGMLLTKRVVVGGGGNQNKVS